MSVNKNSRTDRKRRSRLAPAACWAYHPTYIKEIKAAALRQYKGATSVSHVRPRAYCIAKIAACCAIFVTPPCDGEPLIRSTQNATGASIHEGVSHVEVGKWYVLAYVTTPGCGSTRVIDMAPGQTF